MTSTLVLNEVDDAILEYCLNIVARIRGTKNAIALAHGETVEWDLRGEVASAI